MRFTPEMIAEDEKRWHARDVVIELGYCSTYMRDRKDMTNLDIRFYAYIMRKARDLLEAQEPQLVINIHKAYNNVLNPDVPWVGKCPKCGKRVSGKNLTRFCMYCGQAVKWE